MDNLFTRLEEASYAGDVNSLKEILKKDELLLGKMIGSTSVRDNPLHIAAMVGHADFAREVVNRKPELAKELNSKGLSPLHLAAAHGHVTVVMELLKADLNICLLSEKQEGLLPIHVVVKKRRSVIVKVLVEACEEAMHGITDCGETILHLAIKYNSFDTVEFLIDQVQDLNAKDNRGNTILHHAMASKKLSVIKLLLSKEAINVNTTNMVFLTPLDVLLDSRPQNGDLVLGEMIRKAGGKTAAEVLSMSELVIRDSVSNDRSKNPIPTPRMPLQQPHCLGTKNEIGETTLTSQEENNEKKYDPQILLLVATLVATITFQAALNPPGGFIPDDNDHQDNKGRPVLASKLNVFQIFDFFALFSSVCVMMLLLCVVPRKNKIVIKGLVWVIWIATFSMGMAFIAGISLLYDFKDTSTSIPFHFFRGWLLLFRLGVSGVLVRFLIFLLKKSGLWKPIQQAFASLKRAACFVKWQQFSNTKKINGSNCCDLFKKVVYVVLIFGVLAGISFVWATYKFMELS